MYTAKLRTTTTKLDELRNGATYTWGRLVKIHDIGKYSVIEFAPRPINGAPARETEYTAYVGGKEVGGAVTFEGAILLCIAHGTIPNANGASHMATAACKLFDIPTE